MPSGLQTSPRARSRPAGLCSRGLRGRRGAAAGSGPGPNGVPQDSVSESERGRERSEEVREAAGSASMNFTLQREG